MTDYHQETIRPAQNGPNSLSDLAHSLRNPLQTAVVALECVKRSAHGGEDAIAILERALQNLKTTIDSLVGSQAKGGQL
jgi:hypothetical protein